MTDPVSPLGAVMAGQAPEVSVSRDLVKRGLIAAPVVVLGGFIADSGSGAASAGFALALILLM